MREFHKWEEELPVQAACEKLVQVRSQVEALLLLLIALRTRTYCLLLGWQVLIGDEPEQGMENLMEVAIPLDVEEELSKADSGDREELGRRGDETGAEEQ